MPGLYRFIPQGLRAGFFAGLAVVLAVALVPMSGSSTGNADKAHHFLAFYALALLGLTAYPRPAHAIWVCLGLSAYGGLIELLQPLAWFGRDRDILDWVADNLGIAFAVLPLWAARWRARLFRDVQ